jgi:hypothetical protein
MGGVVNTVKDALDMAVDAVKKVVEATVDIVELSIKTITVPTEIVWNTVVKGESFSGSIAKGIQDIAKGMGNIYDSLLDDSLGIDDNKFLGIKGGVFAKLGMLMRDFTKEHATTTVGISVIVAAIVASILFPPAYGFAGTVTLAAFEAGITSSMALMGVYYATLTVIALGISVIVSGIIDGAVLAMYGDSLLNSIYSFESGQEMLRIAGLAAIMDGTIYDKLAGGWMYDSQFAGGVYYDASNAANLGLSVGGEFSVSPHAARTQFGYIDSTLKDLPGDSNFSVIKTNV